MDVIKNIKIIAENMGNNEVYVKPNTPLSYSIDQTIIGGDRFDETIETISNVLLKEIKFFKNTSMPEMKKVILSIENTINSREESALKITPEIVKLSIPEFVSELKDRGMLNSKSGRLPDIAPVIPHVENKEPYIKTNKGTLGTLMKNFIDTVPMKDIDRVWEDYIMNISFNNTLFLKITNRINYTNETKNDIYILYVLLSNLINEIPDGVVSTLSEYNQKISVALSNVTNTIKTITRLHEVELANGILALGSDINKIIVNEAIYTKYIKNGGVIEAVFGLSVTDIRKMKLTEVKEKEDALINTWSDHNQVLILKHRSGLTRMYKTIYSAQFRQYVLSMEDFKIAQTDCDAMTLIENTEMLVNNLTMNEMYDIQKVVNKLFTEIIYKNTNLKTFLGYISSYKELDPGIGTDRALTFSISEIVTDYIATQLEVTNR